VIKPFFEEMSKKLTTIQFLSVDVDEHPDISYWSSVKAMPTFQVYKDGVKVNEVVGANKNLLRDILYKYA
jgi:thioredoxin 1